MECWVVCAAKFVNSMPHCYNSPDTHDEEKLWIKVLLADQSMSSLQRLLLTIMQWPKVLSVRCPRLLMKSYTVTFDCCSVSNHFRRSKEKAIRGCVRVAGKNPAF